MLAVVSQELADLVGPRWAGTSSHSRAREGLGRMIDQRQARLLAGIWWNAPSNGDATSPLFELFKHARTRGGMTREVLDSVHSLMFLASPTKGAWLYELADLLEFTTSAEEHTMTREERAIIAATIRTLPDRPTRRLIALRFADIVSAGKGRKIRREFMLQCGILSDMPLGASESPRKA